MRWDGIMMCDLGGGGGRNKNEIKRSETWNEVFTLFSGGRWY